MIKEDIHIHIIRCSYDELNDKDKGLIDKAKIASNTGYAPYSHFKVGAAALLSDNTIETGNNQENAAYPSGLCAERVLIFHTNANHPSTAIIKIAIAAIDKKGNFTDKPITPCGSCRQVFIESEKRFNQKIEFLLYGTKEIIKINSAQDLLPLNFNNKNME